MSPAQRSSLLRHCLPGALLVAALASSNANAAAPDAAALAKGGERQLQQAVQQAPNDASLRIQLARVYLKQNNLHAAEAELAMVRQKRLLIDKTNYANVELSEQLDAALSEILYRQGEAGRLLREVPAGNRMPPLESIVRTYRGLAELQVGQRATAQTMLADGERLDPMSKAAKIGMAQFLLAAGDLAAAERKINEALKLAPRDSEALNIKGSIVLAAGRTDEALTYINDALKQNPGNSLALLNRAKLYLGKGDLDHAAEDVRLLQASENTRWMSIYLHASIAARQHDYKTADEALAAFRPAMDRVPEAYLLAGIVKYYLNQFGQADEYLTRYIARDKGRAQAYRFLGAVALKQGNPKRAVEMLDQALKLAPNDKDSLRLLSDAKKASSG